MKIKGVIEDLRIKKSLKNKRKKKKTKRKKRKKKKIMILRNISRTKKLPENELTPHCLQHHQRKS